MIKKILIGLCVVVVTGVATLGGYYEYIKEDEAVSKIEEFYENNETMTEGEKHELCQYADGLKNKNDLSSFIHGYISMEEGNADLAKKNFIKSIEETDFGTPKFVKLYSYKFLADIFLEEKEYRDTIDCIEEVSTIFTKDDYNRSYTIVWEILSTIRNAPDATQILVEYMKSIIEEKDLTNDAKGFFCRKVVVVSLLHENYFEAMNYIIEVLNLPDSEALNYIKGKALVDLAIIAKNLYAPEEAINILESIEYPIKNARNKADLEVYRRINLAQNRTILGQLDEALEDLEMVDYYIEYLPEEKQEEARMLKTTREAQVYVKQNKIEEAEELMEVLITRYDIKKQHSYPSVKVDFLNILGELHINKEEYEEAREIYDSIITYKYEGSDYEDYRESLRQLLFINMKLGDLEGILEVSRKYEEMEQNFQKFQFNMDYEYIKDAQNLLKMESYSKRMYIKSLIYLLGLSVTIFLIIKLNLLPWLIIKKSRKKIREYMANDYYYLVFQPIVDPKRNKVMGLETLLRLNDGKKIVYPNEFIPEIYRAKMMKEITLWEIRKIKQCYKEIKDLNLNIDSREFYVSVNVSLDEIKNKEFIEKIIEETKELFGEGFRICLEITENVGITEKPCIKENIERLIKNGFKIAIDDFGVEYSSTSLLDQFDFHTLKLDKHFIDNVQSSVATKSFMKVINELSQKLEINVVVEGVEEEWQKEYIKSYSSETFYIQGYYYSKPLTIDELKKKDI